MPHLPRPGADERATTRAVIAVAARQHGRVSTGQLTHLGWSKDVITARVASGWLVREHRGVHRLAGAALSPLGRATAAVLAVGPGGVVSHRTGLELHAALPERPWAPIELTTTVHRRSRRGIAVHQAPLEPREVVRIGGVPVTALVRCLVDVARTESAATVTEAVHEAEVLHLLDPPTLLAAAVVGRPGNALLRELAARRLPVSGELVEHFERRFARFLRDRGFPPAEVNCFVRVRDPPRTYRLDVVWWGAGLALELDGRQAHATARAFDEDRERDRRLAVQHGLQVVRVTWRHLTEDPDGLEADLKALLARGLAQRRSA